jgi:hypothetical protein
MRYDLYGTLLFLQPNGSNLYYAVEAIPFDPDIAIPAISPNWNVFEISPSYSTAFEVGARAIFPNTDLSIMVNWERLHSQDRESEDVALSTDMIGPIFNIGPNSSAYTKAKGKATFHFDAVNLTFGKGICLLYDLQTSIYAGATFARIKQTIRGSYENAASTTSRVIQSPSTFTGAGPQFGVHFDYRIYGDFFFTGSSSISLLMGQLKNHETYKSYAPALTGYGIPQPNLQHTRVPNRSQLIPNFDERLGFAYDVAFCSWNLNFEFGYQFQIYMDAVQSINMTAPQVLPSISPNPATIDTGIYAVGFERTLSNFILTGPYLTLNVEF